MSDVDTPNTARSSSDSDEVIELMRDLMEDLEVYLTGGIVRAELDVTFVGQIRQSALHLFDIHGEMTSPSMNIDTGETLDYLREATYGDQVGAWFSAHVVLKMDDSLSATYNYNELPPMAIDFSPSEFIVDLERFPRDASNIPEWLREKLNGTTNHQ